MRYYQRLQRLTDVRPQIPLTLPWHIRDVSLCEMCPDEHVYGSQELHHHYLHDRKNFPWDFYFSCQSPALSGSFLASPEIGWCATRFVRVFVEHAESCVQGVRCLRSLCCVWDDGR